MIGKVIAVVGSLATLWIGAAAVFSFAAGDPDMPDMDGTFGDSPLTHQGGRLDGADDDREGGAGY